MRVRPAGLIMGLLLWLQVGLALAESGGEPGSQPSLSTHGAPRAWPIERNAQQLGKNEWKIGLFGLDVGVHRRLQVGTLWPTWAIGGPNIHLKAQLLDLRGWSLAGELSLFYLRLEHLRWYGVKDVAGSVSVLPMELFLDKQVRPRLLMGVGAGYSLTHVSPQYSPESFRGAGGYDSLLLRGHLTARVHPKLWLVTELDWVLLQTAGAVGHVDMQLTDTIHVNGKVSSVGDPINPARGGALTVSLVVRARRFGFRFGVGYGNWVLPRLRVPVPIALPFVVMDIFGRVGGEPQG